MRPRVRLDAEAVGIGAVLAAVGICCATTLAGMVFGAGIIATVIGVAPAQSETERLRRHLFGRQR